MIGYIEDLYKNLEELDVSETDDPYKARFREINAERCILNFLCGITDEDMKRCLPIAIFNELWGWYCGGTKSGVYQYYEHNINKELIDSTAEALRKYGSEEFAEQYINAGKELIPLLKEEPCNSGLIHETSHRYGEYIDSHALEICMTMRKFLLDNKDEICTVLYGREIRTGMDDPHVIHGELAPEAFFADLINNPLLSEEQRADAAAALENIKNNMKN